MRFYPLVLFIFLAGCAGTNSYHVTNNGCRCEWFSTKDTRAAISYRFSATYDVDHLVHSKIDIEIHNNSLDTVDLSLTYVKVSSRNVPYRYNNKFIPVDALPIPPNGVRVLALVGEAVKADAHDPWLRIAGEELVVTLKGMRLKHRELEKQIVHFIPDNPKIGA